MNDIEPGFYRQSNKEYHAGSGISKSGLARLDRSPLHFKTPQKETDALVVGEAFHVACLEPERFEKGYTPLPLDCRRGTGMKTRKEAFLSDAEPKGQVVIKQDVYEQVKAMSGVIHNTQECIDLLSSGEAEVSGYWYDPDDPSILCKLRMDWINHEEQIIVDLKSCTDARHAQFRSSAFNNNYDMQAAWYLYGVTQITKVEHHDFYFIAIEKEPPYGVKVYKADKEMIDHGLEKCQRALDVYSRCLEKDEWPCYDTSVEHLGLPSWVKNKLSIYD